MPRAFSSGAASIWSYALVFAKILRDRRRQRRLAMVDVTNRANVHMRLGALEFTFCHCLFPRQRDGARLSNAGRLATKAKKHKGISPGVVDPAPRPHRCRRHYCGEIVTHVGIAPAGTRGGGGDREAPHQTCILLRPRRTSEKRRRRHSRASHRAAISPKPLGRFCRGR